ncbi:MAG: SRPBCC family protein [Acidimicrobiales bacterium]|nr:SRPBCC family protein [Acidimicrobiales bacterium]
MKSNSVEVIVPASKEDAWALVGDFGGLDKWTPGVESCRVEGDLRYLSIMGSEVVERLISINDADMEITYTIVSGIPMNSHEATVSVADGDSGTVVKWAFSADPDDAADFLATIYGSALEALKKKLS